MNFHSFYQIENEMKLFLSLLIVIYIAVFQVQGQLICYCNGRESSFCKMICPAPIEHKPAGGKWIINIYIPHSEPESIALNKSFIPIKYCISFGKNAKRSIKILKLKLLNVFSSEYFRKFSRFAAETVLK